MRGTEKFEPPPKIPNLKRKILIDKDALTRRALAAYFRSGGGEQPVSFGVERHGKLNYVALRSKKGLLACYRVRNDGLLKRLKRLPAGVE